MDFGTATTLIVCGGIEAPDAFGDSSVLVTVLDLAVIATFGPTLYRVSIGHSFWLAGLATLFATMFFTLVHAWIQTLRGRFR